MIITDQLLTEYALPILITILIIHMGFIIYNLGKEHDTGKLGNFILIGTLIGGFIGLAMTLFLEVAILPAI